MAEQPSEQTAAQGHQAESVLNLTNSRFRVLLEKLPTAAYTCDAQGQITYFNQQAVRLWGRVPKLNDPGDRFCGSFKLFSASGAPLAHDHCWMALALRTGQEFHGHEIVIERPDGRRVAALAHANTIYDEAGQLLGAANVLVDITERKRAEAELEHLRQELLASRESREVLSRRLIEAQELERQGLARELHDELGQVLTTVHLNLETLRSKIDPAGLERLENSLKVVNIAIEQVRDMSLNLRPASLDLLGLETALRGYLDRQAACADLAVEFTSDLPAKRLPATLETVCFRVVQEALTNIHRHAHAAHCWIELTHSAEQVQIAIRDDGTGFDAAAAKERGLRGEGFGLLGMVERVHLFGGQIEIDSAPRRGTRIRASFSLRTPAEKAVEEKKR